MRSASAALSGLLFALGLTLSGMTQPARVLGFLDVAGDWDPSLAFVMLGALAVYALAYRAIARPGRRPLLDASFHVSTAKRIDARLLTGAALFGVGWGLAGFCPGPALVSAAAGAHAALLLSAGMLVGMLLARRRVRDDACDSPALSQT